MRHILTASALGLLLSLAGLARAESSVPPRAELDELKNQVAALLQRVEQLEQALAAAPAADPQGAGIEARVAAVEASNDWQTDQIAQGLASASAMDWARSIRWKGDLRYRHEQFDIGGQPSDRVRHRLRARLGMDARIDERLAAGFQIATGEIADPRSTNATLDDGNRRKEIALDLAYVDWKPRDGIRVTFGKQKQPWFKPGNSALFDGDVNPEGIAVQYGGRSGPFARIWGYWLEEMSTAADSNLVGAQFGYGFGGGLTLAAGYWDYGAIENQPVLNFSGSPAGNSSFAADASCNASAAGTTRCYRFDYNIVQVDAQWSGELGTLPLMLFGGYLENLDPDELNTGYNLGFQLGRAADPGAWEFGALYQEVERDAQFAALYDSDFADGLTQGRGVLLQGAWVPARNMTIKAAYFINDRSFDTPAETDYRRLQFDLNYRF